MTGVGEVTVYESGRRVVAYLHEVAYVDGVLGLEVACRRCQVWRIGEDAQRVLDRHRVTRMTENPLFKAAGLTSAPGGAGYAGAILESLLCTVCGTLSSVALRDVGDRCGHVCTDADAMVLQDNDGSTVSIPCHAVGLFTADSPCAGVLHMYGGEGLAVPPILTIALSAVPQAVADKHEHVFGPESPGDRQRQCTAPGCGEVQERPSDLMPWGSVTRLPLGPPIEDKTPERRVTRAGLPLEPDDGMTVGQVIEALQAFPRDALCVRQHSEYGYFAVDQVERVRVRLHVNDHCGPHEVVDEDEDDGTCVDAVEIG